MQYGPGKKLFNEALSRDEKGNIDYSICFYPAAIKGPFIEGTDEKGIPHIFHENSEGWDGHPFIKNLNLSPSILPTPTPTADAKFIRDIQKTREAFEGEIKERSAERRFKFVKQSSFYLLTGFNITVIDSSVEDVAKDIAKLANALADELGL